MDFKAAVIILSCLLVEWPAAITAAVDIYQTHLSFDLSDMTMRAENSCKSVVGTSRSFQHHVHVCEDSNRVCFFTLMECCYGIGVPISSETVSVGGKNVTVSFYTAEGGTALCYNIVGNIESCNNKPECLQSCIPADPVCINNTLNGPESCHDGVCHCMPGYAGPDCCKCDVTNGYFKLDDRCIPLCKARCEVPDVMGGCRTCRGDYSLPDCCQCRMNAISCDDTSCECMEGYGGLDCCECAPGYYRTNDGTCEVACVENVVNCTEGICICKEGYTGPGCCECDATNGFVLYLGKCIPLCIANCEVRDDSGVCTTCSGYYSLPDCCLCRGNAVICDEDQCSCLEGYGGRDCCECAPGYFRSEDGTCEVPCMMNTISCTNGVCTCKEGYTGPGCCECDVANGYVLYLEKCKLLCTSNCEVPNANGGCRTCRGDYSLPDCCQCRMNAISCDDTSCECMEGYGGLDCCECAPGYYRTNDGTCEGVCVSNVISCEDETCICKEHYSGDDCCIYTPPTCNRDQDIYFLLDTTLSLDSLPFCEMLHTVEMITMAINRGNNSRTGSYIYPKSSTTRDEDMRFIDIEREECSSAIKKYHDLILEFSFAYKRGYASRIYATITLPVYVIDLLRRDIVASSATRTGTGKPSRRRVAILITDGENDGDEKELSTAVSKLMDETGTTVIAAGLGTSYSVSSYEKFREELKLLANGNARNVVSASNTRQLNWGIVQKMTENGVLCEDQGAELLKILENGDGNLYCDCNSRFFQYNGCKTRCLPRKRRQCRQPPSCS